MSEPFTAAYPGSCEGCGEPIEPGETMIVYDLDLGGWIGWECCADQDEELDFP